jgi:hypothetical protein
MTLVRKVGEVWEEIAGVVNLTRMVDSRRVTYLDGRSADEKCEPYPVEEQVSAHGVEKLVESGVWGAAELEQYGLKRVTRAAEVPAGMMPVGDPIYTELEGGEIQLSYEVAPLPEPPPSPPELTREEKLARMLSDYDLTMDDLKESMGIGVDPQIKE